MPEWNLVISGGGSGGHLYPALAVVEELLRSDSPPRRVVCLTSRRVVESTILSNWEVESVSLPGVTARELLSRPWSGFRKLSMSFCEARRVLQGTGSCVVLGTGGFASVPGVLAAASLRLPIVLLEQNIIMGRANALLRPLAQAVCLSFEQSRRRSVDRNKVTGNPVRRNIASMYRAGSEVGQRRTLLVLGGSQGSRAVHEAMMDTVAREPELLNGWRVVHQAPRDLCATASDVYGNALIECRVAPFFDDIEAIYREAGLVVSRSGATSLAEFACAGLPALLIPDSRSIRNHQELNAQFFARNGGAFVVHEPQSRRSPTWEPFTKVLRELIADDAARQAMAGKMAALARPDAATNVARILHNLVGERFKV